MRKKELEKRLEVVEGMCEFMLQSIFYAGKALENLVKSNDSISVVFKGIAEKVERMEREMENADKSEQD